MIISINIPNENDTALMQAYCAQLGWHSGLGVTRAVFAKQQIIKHIKDTARVHEMQAAAEAAKLAAAAPIDAMNIT